MTGLNPNLFSSMAPPSMTGGIAPTNSPAAAPGGVSPQLLALLQQLGMSPPQLAALAAGGHGSPPAPPGGGGGPMTQPTQPGAGATMGSPQGAAGMQGIQQMLAALAGKQPPATVAQQPGVTTPQASPAVA